MIPVTKAEQARLECMAAQCQKVRKAEKTLRVRERALFSDDFLLEDIHDRHIDIPHRELWLVGEDIARDEADPVEEPGVEFGMSTRFIKNLRILNYIDPDKPILVHMKTRGGDVAEGLAIYDAITMSQSSVTILSYTHARSMSSIILQAADRRVLMPHSYFMFHRGWTQYIGEARAVESGVEFDKRYDEIMLDIFTEKMMDTGALKWRDREAIKDELNDFMGRQVDVFLTPKDTVTWGLADEIFDGNWKRLKETR